jgi:Holliday junction resolvase RusA-like endonuclease
MEKIKIKPLSVNEAWQGKRFKTKKYKDYEDIMFKILPKLNIIQPPYRVNIIVGFSNKASDIDNVLKPFLDILQKKYNINDKHIEILHIEKQVVKKNNEFISFEIVSI